MEKKKPILKQAASFVFSRAPIWAVIILLVAVVFGIVKHYTDWPPFLSQLQIFGIGCILGLVAAALAFRKEHILDETRKRSKNLIPDPTAWVLGNMPGRYYHAAATGYELINESGYWSAIHNGQRYYLGTFNTADELNQAVKTYYQNLH